jgi:hypothetical protein
MTTGISAAAARGRMASRSRVTAPRAVLAVAVQAPAPGGHRSVLVYAGDQNGVGLGDENSSTRTWLATASTVANVEKHGKSLPTCR